VSKFMVFILLLFSSVAQSEPAQPIGSVAGVEFTAKIAALPDGSGGHYDEALLFLRNTNSYSVTARMRVILHCKDGTDDSSDSGSATTIGSGQTVGGEGGGLWYRGCQDHIRSFSTVDVSVKPRRTGD
jgi:hypothetical protein